MNLSYKTLSSKTWNDFETLFGDKGACGGCWCMYWRLKSSDFEKNKGIKNKRLMKELVAKKENIGLIFYNEKIPIGWISISPREKFIRFESSKVLKKIDDEYVWSLVCFFIDKKFRRQGNSVEMLKKTIEFCKKKKIKIIEAYPVIPYNIKMPDAFAWTGFYNSFLKAGFEEKKRWSKSRPIMRCYV